jgi:cyclopropane-fatty-acyl-phospholipid synthase
MCGSVANGRIACRRDGWSIRARTAGRKPPRRRRGQVVDVMSGLAGLLGGVLTSGTLEIRNSRGRRETIARSGFPRYTVMLKRPGMSVPLMLYPSYYLPKYYVDGSLEIEGGDLRGLLSILMSGLGDDRNLSFVEAARQRLQSLFDAGGRVGEIRRSKRDVQFHYDLSNDFFSAFLDSNMQYSCAYFDPWDASLETAQVRKMAHIAAKLDLRPRARLLDIGCGWGGLAAFLARHHGVSVTGVTLSERQAAYAHERWSSVDIDVRLEDYRQHAGRYDRIVSVGMLEHVGRSRFDEYFMRIGELLRDDGLALVHTIGRRGPPMHINPWIRRHIFPGSYLPSLSQLAAAIERQGLWLVDCENLRLHYARTLEHWRRNVEARRSNIVASFGAPFYRAWEFYLTASELGFIHQGLTVYQLLVARSATAAPLTRDFMWRAEAELSRRLAAECHTGCP